MIRVNTSFGLFLLLLVGVTACLPENKPDYWSLLDERSIAVYETSTPPDVDSLLAPYFKVSAPSFIVAWQQISKRESGLLYSCQIQKNEFEGLAQIKPNAKLRSIVRKYNGYDIQELKSQDNKTQVSFSYLDGVFVISKSSFLIENAIRVFVAEKPVAFKSANRALFKFASVKSDAGNLYLNYSSLLDTAPDDAFVRTIPVFSDFAKSAVLDVKILEQGISLNGFTTDSTGRTSGLRLFQKQQPVKIDLMRFVPISSDWVVHYGISQMGELLQSTDSLNTVYGNELAFCAEGNGRHLIYVESGTANTWFDESDFFESYSGYEIVSANRKPVEAFKKFIPSDSIRYGVQLESYVVLASEVSLLKNLIDQVEADETWGKSLAFQQFLEHGLQESNVSIFFKDMNLEQLPAGLVKSLFAPKQSKVTWGSIQFSALDDHFYTSINIDRSEARAQRTNDRIVATQLPNVITSAFPVKNHLNAKSELILQDTTFRIYQFSADQGLTWSYSLNNKIKNLAQIDYLKNGKLQYLITTASELYLIDRLGRDVPGFPKKLSFHPHYSEIVDYDKTRNYRYLMTTGEKAAYILDKEGSPLTDWSPKKIGGVVNKPPAHYRIGGRDYFLLLTADNEIYLLNRKGETQPGYPIALKHFVSGDYFVETGSSLATSYFYCVSKEGRVTRIALDGKPLTSEDLVRGNQSRFEVVRASSKEFYYSRVDTDKIAVFNKANQLVFERQNPGSISLQPSAFVISSERVIFSFFDADQNLTYLFDQVGNPVGKPLECSIPPVFGMNLKDKKSFVYSLAQESITITPLN